ncbi:MAG: hypothetical protein JWN62_3850 [Acidimicrobiales bacterium]|nr:hypothetical protein [Acidimicrobiales bacterium]
MVEADTGFSFGVRAGSAKPKSMCWVWQERIDPKKPRVPNPAVLAVRVSDLGEKEVLLAADPHRFHTEAHYNGYPAVLVHLSRVDDAELRELLTDAWRCTAPKRLVKELDAG